METLLLGLAFLLIYAVLVVDELDRRRTHR